MAPERRRRRPQHVWIVEARHFFKKDEDSWFPWSYAAHSDKKIIAEHARMARKHFPAYNFRSMKYVQEGK